MDGCHDLPCHEHGSRRQLCSGDHRPPDRPRRLEEYQTIQFKVLGTRLGAHGWLRGRHKERRGYTSTAEQYAKDAAMIEVEDRLTRRMDELIGNLVPDVKQRDLYTVWRKNAADLRRLDKEAVIAFRETIKGKSPEARMQAFQKHWQARIKRMADMKRENKDGLAMMPGEARAAAVYRGQADVAELRRVAPR